MRAKGLKIKWMQIILCIQYTFKKDFDVLVNVFSRISWESYKYLNTNIFLCFRFEKKT